jgi:phosphohistidine phosphatase SixA
MKLTLVRHARKQQSDGQLAEESRPIDGTEVSRAEALRESLRSQGLDPRYILTSSYLHARQTAELLRCPRTRQIIPITGLTPHTEERAFSLAAMLYEASAHSVEWTEDEVLLLVGHEGRLSNLAQRLTGTTRPRQLNHLEGLTLEISVKIAGEIRA